MECDVAVLGGGPGGYPAAIRAAQLGAKVVLIEQARVGGTCITVGCIPTKAWVQTAHALKEAHGHFAQLGVNVSRRRARLRDHPEEQGDASSAGSSTASPASSRPTASRSSPAAAASRTRTRSRSRAARTSASSRPSSPPARTRCARRSTASTAPLLRRLDRAARGRAGAAAGRDPGRRRDRRRVRLDPAHFGSEVTIVEMLDQPDPDRGRRRGQGARSGRSRSAASPCTSAPARPASSTARRGHPALRVGRRHRPARSRPTWCWSPPAAARNVARHRPRAGRRRVRSPQGHRRPTPACARTCRTSSPSATWPAAGSSRTPAFREGEVAAENAARPRRRDRLRGRAALHLHRSRGRRRSA